MSVVHVWAGASSATGFWVRGKVTGASTRLAVSEADDLSSPSYFGGPETPTADGMVSIAATGLEAGTRYWYALEDDSALDTDFIGTVVTHPVAPGERASYTFGAAGDAGLTGAGDDSYITDEVSDNPVFTTMRAQALSEGWTHFSHLGDLHYRNIATADSSLYRAAYDDTLTFNGTLGADARQGAFYRGVASTYAWDDHDFGPNNSDRTAAGNGNANAVYRERVPHYDLAADGIYQSWQIGRVLYIQSDVRTFRDPNSDPQGPGKTMLGAAQKTWMEQVLTADTGAEALVWIMPSQWIATTSDSWASFIHERDELVTLLGDTRWLPRTVQLTADKHALSFSSGPGNRWGGFPIFMFASLDASYGTVDAQWDLGMLPCRQGYGTVAVRDDGHTIALTGTGYVNGSVWRAHTKYAYIGTPALTLDYTAGHLSPPMEPTEDDQLLTNDVTASRAGGGEERTVRESGPLSVQEPPDGVGTYASAVTLEVASDRQLADQAGWRVHLGTVDEPRVGSLTVDLAKNRTGVTPEVAELRAGDALTVVNGPVWLPPDPLGQIAEGHAETIGDESWRLELNSAPSGPWWVGQLPPGDEETAQPAQPNRLDTTGSVLTVEVAEAGTELVVHTPQDGVSGRAVWLTAMRVFNGNYRFEKDLTEWVGNGATITRVETPGDPPFLADWCMRIVPDGVAEFPNAGSDQYDVVPGEEYTVSGWLRCDTARGVDLNINWFDAGFGYLDTGSNGVLVAAGEWAFIQGTFTAPAGAARANMAPTMDGTPPPEDVLYATLLTIRPAGGMPAQLPYDLRVGGETVRALSVEPLHWDEFGRDSTDTWGTSSSGLAWVESGGAATDRAVAGGVGTLTLATAPSEIRFQRSTDDIGDCEVHVTMSPDQVATGASMIPAIIFRHTGINDFYRARLHFSVGGGMFTSVSRGTTQVGDSKELLFDYEADDVFHLRARLIGHRILIRAWPDTQAEPVVWHNDELIPEALGRIDTGGIGVSASGFSGNTNTAPTISYDGFEVVSPQRMSVERSLNGVVKPHPAGAAVSLARPAVLGL